MNILDPLAVASTAGASTRASFTHEVPVVEMDDDGAPTNFSRST